MLTHIRSLIPSKKEVWLSDEATSPSELSSYMRGEKPEIAHPVVAWASQTGLGLLFLNKKGETNRKQPGHILALYDATDLKKPSAHEIAFKIGAHEHVLKAASDDERDGWYMSIEKAVELGKASKDEIHERESYKEELEKLSKLPKDSLIACLLTQIVDKPNSTTTTAVASKRSQSQPKKSTEVERAHSDDVVEDKKKSNKSRSTSRGVLNRFKSKKEETEPKPEATEVEQDGLKSEDDKGTDAIAATAAATAIAGAAGIAAGETVTNGELPLHVMLELHIANDK